MAKITNHAPGLRGILLVDGSTVWLEPGKSADIKKDDIASMPDLGEPGAANADLANAAGEIDDLRAEVTMLKDDNEVLTKANADLAKQVEALTKPAK